MSKFRILIVWGVLLTLTSLSVAVEIDPLKADPAAMKQWHDMRFGLFIHWGLVSLTGHEIGWSRGRKTPNEEYNQLYQKFNPTEFNAEEWGKIAKDRSTMVESNV